VQRLQCLTFVAWPDALVKATAVVNPGQVVVNCYAWLTIGVNDRTKEWTPHNIICPFISVFRLYFFVCQITEKHAANFSRPKTRQLLIKIIK